ncbi:hypothetical protein K523DRAFT_82624 [Schizophyllum commune Tattone D]|nr:hypothetical protein K523DRAFT_82624 [Schizophyllum commune Tattone D]
MRLDVERRARKQIERQIIRTTLHRLQVSWIVDRHGVISVNSRRTRGRSGANPTPSAHLELPRIPRECDVLPSSHELPMAASMAMESVSASSYQGTVTPSSLLVHMRGAPRLLHIALNQETMSSFRRQSSYLSLTRRLSPPHRSASPGRSMSAGSGSSGRIVEGVPGKLTMNSRLRDGRK